MEKEGDTMNMEYSKKEEKMNTTLVNCLNIKEAKRKTKPGWRKKTIWMTANLKPSSWNCCADREGRSRSTIRQVWSFRKCAFLLWCRPGVLWKVSESSWNVKQVYKVELKNKEQQFGKPLYSMEDMLPD